MSENVRLLVDPGAHSNLSGDRWVKRVSALAPTPAQYQLLDKPQTVEGAGAGDVWLGECAQ